MKAMRAAVIVFPGSNCERDVKVAIERITDGHVSLVWHADRTVPDADLIVLPGGFAYGDYLRTGAMAAHSPIMRDVVAKAKAGTPTIGVCNGFQVLCEAGLLPGVLMRNASLKYVCRDVWLKVEQTGTPFTSRFEPGEVIRLPIGHGEGSYFADRATLDTLETESRIVFRYVDSAGNATAESNPNGALGNIAGICDERRRVLGMMPHPERLFEPMLGGTDGRKVFESMLATLR
jgi:phosphoribosylformylglycinamidine synthase